jgi:hypothetical protein
MLIDRLLGLFASVLLIWVLTWPDAVLRSVIEDAACPILNDF